MCPSLLDCLGRLAHLLAHSDITSVVDAASVNGTAASAPVARDPRVTTLRDEVHRDRLLSLAQHAALTFAPPGLAVDLLRHAAASTTLDSTIVLAAEPHAVQAAFVRQEDEIKFDFDDQHDDLGCVSSRVGRRTDGDAIDTEPCLSLWLRAMVLRSREAALRLAALPLATDSSTAPLPSDSGAVAAPTEFSAPAAAAAAVAAVAAASNWSHAIDWASCPLGCVLADGRVLAAPRLELPLTVGAWSEHRSHDVHHELRSTAHQMVRPTVQPQPEQNDADRHAVNKRRRRAHLPADCMVDGLTTIPVAAPGAIGVTVGGSCADGSGAQDNLDLQTFSHLQASIELF